jgi:putative membrane protein
VRKKPPRQRRPKWLARSRRAATDSELTSYVEKAAIGDMFEIESSKLALERAQVAGVKAFAQQIIDAHTATSEELKLLATSAGLTSPAALDDQRRGTLEDLQKASDEDFDDRYTDQQSGAQRCSFSAQGLCRRWRRGRIKAFAAATWPRVQQHLEHVKALGKSDADDKTKPR